jgi:hypothetical protein
MSKPELRKHLASLSFAEKLKLLEKLRDRSLAIGASRAKLKLKLAEDEHPRPGQPR